MSVSMGGCCIPLGTQGSRKLFVKYGREADTEARESSQSAGTSRTSKGLAVTLGARGRTWSKSQWDTGRLGWGQELGEIIQGQHKSGGEESHPVSQASGWRRVKKVRGLGPCFS